MGTLSAVLLKGSPLLAVAPHKKPSGTGQITRLGCSTAERD